MLMRQWLEQIAPVLHLTRVTTAFAAVANVWLVLLWSRAHAEEDALALLRDRPLWLLLAGGAAAAVGLYAYGACLNDFLDIHRDRALRPTRPLASGRASTQTAVVAVVSTLMLSVLGATVFGNGAVVATVGLAGAILLFHAAGKFVPAIGLVLLSVIYAGHMLVPNLWVRFLPPVWLVMTHAMAVAGLTHWLGRKAPPMSRRALVFAIGGWVVCTVVLVAIGWQRQGGTLWPAWVPTSVLLMPGALVVMFVVLVIRRIRTFGPGPRAAEKIERYGSLWLALYACAWLLGAGKIPESLIMMGLAAAGFAGMTVLREVYALAEHPLGYRR